MENWEGIVTEELTDIKNDATEEGCAVSNRK